MENIFVFDIDDTLYDQLHAFRRSIENLRISDKNGLDISVLYQLMKKYGDETFSSTGFNQTELRKMQVFRIERSLQDYDIYISDNQALKFQLDFEKYQNDIELFPKMKELLNLLTKKNQTIGIITNGTIDRQSKKIKKLDLENWVPKNNILISEEVGISKPEKCIFKCFEDRLSLTLENKIYHIGDNYFNNIVGAKTVDWDTIWVNYRKYSIPNECVADYIVEDTESLYVTVKNLMNK